MAPRNTNVQVFKQHPLFRALNLFYPYQSITVSQSLAAVQTLLKAGFAYLRRAGFLRKIFAEL